MVRLRGRGRKVAKTFGRGAKVAGKGIYKRGKTYVKERAEESAVYKAAYREERLKALKQRAKREGRKAGLKKSPGFADAFSDIGGRFDNVMVGMMDEPMRKKGKRRKRSALERELGI